MLKAHIKLMRMHHYIKNLLIFAALVFSGQFFQREKFLSGLLGFCSFCMISSVVYIVNDIRDREKDRLHPVKCQRPIASGEVSVKSAIFLSIILLLGGVTCNIGVFHISSSLLLILYLILNFAYSFGCKNLPIVDIAILVSGFLIRVMYGAVVTQIDVSNWLYLTVMAAAFYFALGKRRNELNKINSGKTRKVLKAYPVNFLDKNMYMCLVLMNVFYSLWSMEKSSMLEGGSKYLIFTVPIVLVITLKYSMDIEAVCDGGQNSDGDPVEVLLHDKMLLGLCGAYVGIMFAALYL